VNYSQNFDTVHFYVHWMYLNICVVPHMVGSIYTFNFFNLFRLIMVAILRGNVNTKGHLNVKARLHQMYFVNVT
jgi:hypothetical protein